jgi:hypothetical protein
MLQYSYLPDDDHVRSKHAVDVTFIKARQRSTQNYGHKQKLTLKDCARRLNNKVFIYHVKVVCSYKSYTRVQPAELSITRIYNLRYDLQ